MRNKIVLSMNCPKCGAKVKDGASFCPNCGNKLSQPSNKSPFQIFKEGCGFYKRLDNSIDVLVYPIDESFRSLARANFGIERSEEILMIRDTSFWNSKNQGAVLTDKAIHVISDNDNINEDTTINWSWEIISKVEYQEMNLYFYDYQGNNSYIGMSYFLKDGSDERLVASVGRQLASLLTRMAQASEPQEDPVVVAFGEWDDLQNAGKFDEAYKYAKDLQTYDLGTNQWLACDCAASSAFQQKLYEIALEETNQALQLVEENSPHIVGLLYRKYSCYHLLGNDNEARKDCLTVVQHATDEKRADGVLVKEDAKADFTVYEKQFVEGYLDRPYNERKVLMPVKKYTDLHQEIVNVIEVANLPKEIIFPMGHPIANQLYIGHPLLPHKYIPFENYQLELIEDKVREFCSIVQALGATEIDIECLNSNSGDYSSNGKRNIEGNAGHKVVDVNGSYHNEYSRRLIEELNHSIKLHQTFTPSSAPSLPDELIWYNNEPSWQRLYNQRMTGSLLTHEERIETRKSQMVESNELTEIKGEIKTLFSSAGGSWTKNEEAKYQIQENAVLAINVKFAPMNQLAGGNMQQIPQQVIPAVSMDITENEQEYLDEVKECLADGEIGDKERRRLNRWREKLGISEERAIELENSLQKPQLTEEEQEYLAEYKECLADGEIGSGERRFLNKVRNKLGISEERATEIELLTK